MFERLILYRVDLVVDPMLVPGQAGCHLGLLGIVLPCWSSALLVISAPGAHHPFLQVSSVDCGIWRFIEDVGFRCFFSSQRAGLARCGVCSCADRRPARRMGTS